MFVRFACAARARRPRAALGTVHTCLHCLQRTPARVQRHVAICMRSTRARGAVLRARTTTWTRVGGTRIKPKCRIGKEPTHKENLAGRFGACAKKQARRVRNTHTDHKDEPQNPTDARARPRHGPVKLDKSSRQRPKMLETFSVHIMEAQPSGRVGVQAGVIQA